MKDFEYYGLFLTEESKDKLNRWLCTECPQYIFNGMDWEDIHVHLDHCTLLHKSQRGEDNYLIEEHLKFMLSVQVTDMPLEIDGIGVSDKAMAFRCNLSSELCANKTPHITICTFNGGKPVDSNNIKVWGDIKPIKVEVKLKRV